MKISYTDNYLFCKLDSYTNYVTHIIIQIRQLYELGYFNLTFLRTVQSDITLNLSSLRHSESLKPTSR